MARVRRAGGRALRLRRGRKGRVAVLFHERQAPARVPFYAVHWFTNYWREDGLEVVYLFGVERFVPADVVLVHVDLSVVPDEYLEFARRYPVALNAGVQDIRKSTFSSLRVTPEHHHDGAVMVKSDLNYAGVPERVLDPSSSASAHFDDPVDYPIFGSVAEVPSHYFESEDLVVERFVPEREGDRFHTRTFDFLGDRYTSLRLASNHPVANSSTHFVYEHVDPAPELFELRAKLGLDYGKLDYVIHDSEVILFDVNKTMGANDGGDERAQAMRRHRAGGIHQYLG